MNNLGRKLQTDNFTRRHRAWPAKNRLLGTIDFFVYHFGEKYILCPKSIDSRCIENSINKHYKPTPAERYSLCRAWRFIKHNYTVSSIAGTSTTKKPNSITSRAVITTPQWAGSSMPMPSHPPVRACWAIICLPIV